MELSVIRDSIITANTKRAAGDCLTFTLGTEEYGIEILKVQEIRGYDAVTHIANTPNFIKGVINLRGKIIPIVDLRIKLNQSNVIYNELTVVIVLNLNGRVVGVVVDGVSDVITLTEDQIREVPAIVANIDTKYILGLATFAERMLTLVDIEQLLNNQDMASIDDRACSNLKCNIFRRKMLHGKLQAIKY